MNVAEWRVGLAFVALLAALAAAGPWMRRGQNARCAFDGGAIEPLYQVRVVGPEHAHEFCCIRCAESWLLRQATPAGRVLVIDEQSGDEIDAASAFFVRNLVVTNKTTGNRIHVFATEQAATAHAQALGGQLLTGADTPFRGTVCLCPDAGQPP